MKSRTRRAQLVAVAAAGVLALTACGGDSDSDSGSEGADGQESTGGGGEGDGESLADLSPQEVSDRAQEALGSATSVRMRTLTDPEVIGMGLDLHMDQDGSCEGSVTQGGGGSVELLVRENDEVWMKPDAAFWQSQLAVADEATLSLLEGKYLYGHLSDTEFSQMAGACSLSAMQSELGSDEGSGGPDEVGPETDYNGTPVITLTGPDDEGNEVTMLIANEGEPYPLLVRTAQGGTDVEIELSQYGEPVEFEEPPADQVLDIADFRTGDVGA